MRYITFLFLSLVCTSPLWANLQNELSEQQERLTVNQNLLNNALRLQRKLSRSLTEVGKNRLAVQTQKEILAAQLNGLVNSIEIHSRSLVALSDDLERQRKHVKKLFMQAWRINPTLPWRSLLTPSEPNQIARQMAWLKYIVQAQRQAIITLEALRMRKVDLVAQGHVGLERQASTEQELKDRSRELLRLERQERNKQEQLENSITELRRNQTQLGENVEELQKVIATFQHEKNNFQDNKNSNPVAGQLIWPVDGKVATGADVESRFGSKAKTKHQGMLIIGEGGTAVRAVHRGRVVFSGHLKGWGATIVVKHGRNFLSVYAYNESLAKLSGDFVEAGETLATLSAYNALKTIEAPVLYFAIFQGGRSLDPSVWLASRE